MAPVRETSSRAALILALGLLVVVLVAGGSSRADALSQLPVRLAAAVLGGAALYLGDWRKLRVIRPPLILLLGLLLVAAVQLVPLPPDIWQSLPGRTRFVDLAELAGTPQPWRPISLVPHATANSILAMIVSLAVLVSVGLLSVRRFPVIVFALVGLAMVSGLLGAAQVAADGSLSIYRISNHGNATGFFANRNHQAAWMAATVPLLAALSALPQENLRSAASQALLGLTFVLILPLVFVTGSRSGIFLLILGIGLAALIHRKAGGMRRLPPWVSKRLLAALALALAAGVAALVFFRVGGMERLLTVNVEEDLRVSTLPTVLKLAATYFPVGGGFGAFPDLYKIDEPFARLNFQYFNHAHNDVLEIMIEGGLPAALLGIAFLGWLCMASLRLWRAPLIRNRTTHILALAGSAGMLILLCASLVDYPLRTPALAGFAAVLAALIAAGDSALSSQWGGARNNPGDTEAAGR